MKISSVVIRASRGKKEKILPTPFFRWIRGERQFKKVS